MKIGVISDTHGILRDDVIENLRGCDYIIHAGDVGGKEIVDTLEEIAKTFVVRGNNDGDVWGKSLPQYKEIEMDQKLIYVVHDKMGIPDSLGKVDIIIYGHSHKYHEEEKEGVLYLNPGACGKKRFSLPLTMAIVEIEGEEVSIHKIEL